MDDKKIEINSEATDTETSTETRKPFVDPKLAFIEPKLTKHGDATKITQGFFGTFNP